MDFGQKAAKPQEYKTKPEGRTGLTNAGNTFHREKRPEKTSKQKANIHNICTQNVHNKWQQTKRRKQTNMWKKEKKIEKRVNKRGDMGGGEKMLKIQNRKKKG